MENRRHPGRPFCPSAVNFPPSAEQLPNISMTFERASSTVIALFLLLADCFYTMVPLQGSGRHSNNLKLRLRTLFLVRGSEQEKTLRRHLRTSDNVEARS